ncbi:RING-type zinc-finger LisH dimerization motif [Arabidopsis suecica]|uniref:RING-type zinc-finger LisH dimerization motif n=1 Tax=Arabidopsis suecica TaxID=45249 RepID=A0A8T2BR78_ARASU|nr:RING-type zinc-finger LisH dimerization motif [Arabidopsis suecica]
MWNLASKSIREGLISQGEEAATKQRKAPSDSSGDGRRTTKEEKLECPICWESFNVVENVPYVLWCGHTICKYCLLGLQRAVVIKSSALPFQLPFFVACPWCNILSLRLVCNGTIKFPSKNFYLLWMVESMNGCRSEARSDNKRVTSGQRNLRKRCDGVSNTASDDGGLLDNRSWWNGVTRGFFRTGRLHDSFLGFISLSRLLWLSRHFSFSILPSRA